MPARRITFLAVASCLLFTRPTATAQATHPTVQFAANLLKQGQIEEALSALKSRVDADPTDCKAIGLVALGYLQQRDVTRAQPWIERLSASPSCAAASTVAAKMSGDIARREELVLALARLVPTGDLRQIDDTIIAAEKTLGTLPAVRAYVDALKGEFPLLEDKAQQPSLSAELIEALAKRKAAVSAASNSVSGAFLAKWSFPDAIEDAELRAIVESDGYRVGHGLYVAANSSRGAPAAVMANAQKLFAWYAEQIRTSYELAPLAEDQLSDMMMLAFLSGSTAQIDSVASLMRRAFNRIKWAGIFNSKDATWEHVGVIIIDFDKAVVSYQPSAGLGPNRAKAPKEATSAWSIPFSQIRDFVQEDTKFGAIRAGYRALRLESTGGTINGQHTVPLPARIEWFSLAYAEEPVRQSVREYGSQIGRLVNLAPAKVKLVGEKSGGGAFSFRQLWTAGSMVFSQATGNTAMTQFWSQQLSQASADAAAGRQLSAEAANAWEQAKRDPVLRQALTVEGVNAEIDRLLR